MNDLLKARFIAALERHDTGAALAILNPSRYARPIEEDAVQNTWIRGFIFVFLLNFLKIIFTLLRLPYQQPLAPVVSGIDSIIKDPNVLIKAISCREMAVVTELIDAGADVNAIGTEFPYTAISVAVLSGSLESVNLLLQKGANAGDVKLTFLQPLAFAVKQRTCTDSLNIIRALVAKGADVNSRMPPKNGQYHYFICETTYNFGTSSSLEYIADVGYVNILTHAVLNNPNNQLGEDIVKLLIELGADVNQESKFFTCGIFSNFANAKMLERANFTPLAAALMVGNSKISKVLINAGAKQHASFTDKMQSAYHTLVHEIENERRQTEAAQREAATLSTLQQTKTMPVPSAPPMPNSRRRRDVPVARVIRDGEVNPEADLATEEGVPTALAVSSSRMSNQSGMFAWFRKRPVGATSSEAQSLTVDARSLTGFSIPPLKP